MRDRILSVAEYADVMHGMIDTSGFDVAAAKANLWMTNTDLADLANAGHVIGLHSYTHPIRIEELPADQQRSEYDRNRRHIIAATGGAPLAVSHPCNSYNAGTLAILTDLGAGVGFRSNMAHGPARSLLEMPREDHTNIVRAMT